ncbi:MAG: sugar transferase [Phycisphaerae bacterium]
MAPRASPLAEALRRALDLLIAGAVLFLGAPVVACFAWRIRRDSPGPAIFRQRRAGRAGEPFVLLKFRTMRTDADPYGPSPRAGDDPRLTTFGRWLREKSLDELPQLWNVLRGDMTLVGPRPLYVEQMAEWTPRQRLRLAVKPGLTGLAQISGRAGLTLEEKLELDVQYVLSRSLRLDAAILLRTLGVWRRAGDIYEVRYSKDRETRG